MNLVFHISEDGSEIELKHCASNVKSLRNISCTSIGRDSLPIPVGPIAQLVEDASSTSARESEFFVVLCSVRLT